MKLNRNCNIVKHIVSVIVKSFNSNSLEYKTERKSLVFYYLLISKYGSLTNLNVNIKSSLESNDKFIKLLS